MEGIRIPWNKGKKQLLTTGDKNPAKRPEVRKKISLALKGRSFSEEHRRKISEQRRGKSLSELHKRKISEAIKGTIRSEENRRNISKGLKGHLVSEETRRKISESNSGAHHFNFGKRFSEETRRKISEGLKGKNIGKRRTEEQRKKMSERERGEKAPNWRGGLSFFPYTIEWTKTLKRSIRERDHYICQVCSALQSDYAFDIHHIDYNKENCNPDNLITLCRSCHAKTGHDRSYWQRFFKIKMKERGCY
jgi:5-methylcytosine-specific restriction endonuclease McrA